MVHKTSFFTSHDAAGSSDEPGAKAIAEISRVLTRLQQVHKNNPTPANEKALQTVQTLLQGAQMALDETPTSEASLP
ncbi:MAG: hypothetical protein JJT82_03910 [Legionellaceae bacterium]|nr:hypothetical protein [Legionellaceae bacterium]